MIERAVSLLEKLISTPSISRQEERTAIIIERHLQEAGIKTERLLNNIIARSDDFNPNIPTLLLNSHHDTVKPASGYTFDPFSPIREEGKIYGLGSNDAGGSVVSLIESFIALHNRQTNVNLILAITAEEEVSGQGGIEAVLNHFKGSGTKIDMAIVGEPTSLNAAIGERGLVVLDCVAKGVSGHAARNEGVNAIYEALQDIETLRNFRFPDVSQVLGDITMTTTIISAGTQHNVVPDKCDFVVDIRTTDMYGNSRVVEILRSVLKSEIKPRSTRLNASVIDEKHPLVKGAKALGAETFVSPTLSDRALMHHIPALKIGPGDSARSHTANEFIYEAEIISAIDFYKNLILSL